MKKLKKIYVFFEEEKFADKLKGISLEVIYLKDYDKAKLIVCDEKNADDGLFLSDMCELNHVSKMPFIVYLHENNLNKSFKSGAYCVECLDSIDEEYINRIFLRFHGLPWKILETERLSIEEISVEDVYRLKELYKDERVTLYMEDLFPLEEEIEYTKNYIKNVYGFYGYGMWLIKQKENGLVIGRAGIESKEGFEGLELGFMLGCDYWNKGYAYEACRAVLDYARNELEIYDFNARVHEKNEASKKLCQRLGFIVTDKKEDFLIYSIREGKNKI